MKAVIITQPGAPGVLQVQNRPIPQPGANQVLIKVAAAGVNRPDVAQRKGQYPPPPGVVPDIPGLEIAGIITQTGDTVTRWKVGDHVCALVSGGGYAEYCCAPEGQCLPIPANLSFAEAAAIPETFFTVWSNVFDRAGLKPGERLLVHGGSSGIGVAAIQIAKALGSDVYVTAGSDAKCHFCLNLGATAAINYNTQDFRTEIDRLTGGKGVNVILDMIGGNYMPLNLECLATEGRLAMINTMKGKDVQVDLGMVMRKRLHITGSTLRNRDVKFKSAIAQSLEAQVWPLLANGAIKAVVYKIFPAGDAAQAHQLMESSAHTGKIVLEWE